MIGDVVTLYHPSDGLTEGSNSSTYKGIKDFKVNNDGTITFKTQKHGTITTPCLWRLKTGVELNDVEENAAPAVAPRRQARGY